MGGPPAVVGRRLGPVWSGVAAFGQWPRQSNRPPLIRHLIQGDVTVDAPVSPGLVVCAHARRMPGPRSGCQRGRRYRTTGARSAVRCVSAFVRKPTQAPSGTCSPAGGSWARTRAPSPVGSPSATPLSTTFSPAACTMSIALGRVSLSTFGTTVAAWPLATHVGATEVEVPVEAVTVEVVVGAATESSSVHAAKLSSPTTPTTRRTRGRTSAYCPISGGLEPWRGSKPPIRPDSRRS
jgi:hypothetical protein